MTKHAGKFFWYDLMTSDPKAAQAFYSKVVGWTAKDSGVPGQEYTLLSAGDMVIGGLMQLPKEAADRGVPPCWSGYIAVDDVDDCALRIKVAGGSVEREPHDIPHVGRFAVVADPGGAVFLIMKPFSTQEMPVPSPMAIGNIGWRELQANNLQEEFNFYSGLFGWTKAEAMDMGPMGVYQMFKTGDEHAVGGMMTKAPQAPGTYWLYYFNVDAIDAAVTRVTEGGGRIVHGPSEVPGPMYIVQALDPQGAMFALVAPKR